MTSSPVRTTPTSHSRRATQPIHNTCEVGEEGLDDRCGGPRRQDQHIARRVAALVDLGPGQGDGTPQELYRRNRPTGLLLRSRSPWQRGSNENTNGLLRQYFPRSTNLSQVSQDQLDAVALRLNQRPRKTLDFETPADRLRKVLQ